MSEFADIPFSRSIAVSRATSSATISSGFTCRSGCGRESPGRPSSRHPPALLAGNKTHAPASTSSGSYPSCHPPGRRGSRRIRTTVIRWNFSSFFDTCESTFSQSSILRSNKFFLMLSCGFVLYAVASFSQRSFTSLASIYSFCRRGSIPSRIVDLVIPWRFFPGQPQIQAIRGRPNIHG